MHQLHDLLDSRLILGKIENLLRACITREHSAARIVPVRAELGYVESNLQAIFARQQVLLRLLARADILDHDCVAQWPPGPVANDMCRRALPSHFSVFTSGTLFRVEKG